VVPRHLHSALGHTFVTTATRDLDLALALSSWDDFRALAAAFPRVGDTGIRFRIVDVDVDLLPFGDIEDPQGVVKPPSRGETLSVWAFEEIFAASLPLAPSPTTTIHIPTVAGYAAAKLGAWFDRSDWLEAKDAADLALILHWYAESADVHDRLYETSSGNEILIAEDTDVPLAAAHLLGTDVATTIGAARLAELLARWPGDAELLIRKLELRGGPAWPRLTTATRPLGRFEPRFRRSGVMTRAQTLAGAMGLASWRAHWTLSEYAAAATGGGAVMSKSGMPPSITSSIHSASTKSVSPTRSSRRSGSSVQEAPPTACRHQRRTATSVPISPSWRSSANASSSTRRSWLGSTAAT